MKPIHTITAVFLGSLAVVAAVTALLIGEEAVRAGMDLLRHRVHLDKALADLANEKRTLVVWMGDSTLFWSRGRPPYPEFLNREPHRLRDVKHSVVSLLGLDFFHYYCILGAVLDVDPEFVVLHANLRMFERPDEPMMDLCSFLPPAELPRAIWLPLHERGLSPIPLLALQALRFDPAERAFLGLDGARKLLDERDSFGLLVRRVNWLQEMIDDGEPKQPATQENLLQAYDMRLHARQGTVRMMAAAVRMAVRRDTPVLVVASPIPHRLLAERGWYAPENFDLLRRVVETKGGRFLDLHDALDTEHFSDVTGHYSREGAQRMAELLAPVVAEMLQRSALKR